MTPEEIETFRRNAVMQYPQRIDASRLDKFTYYVNKLCVTALMLQNKRLHNEDQ
jgi:hypothetical protein